MCVQRAEQDLKVDKNETSFKKCNIRDEDGESSMLESKQQLKYAAHKHRQAACLNLLKRSGFFTYHKV